MFKKFYEYAAERERFDDFKTAVLNAIDATDDATSERLSAFEKAKDLSDPNKNPSVANLINQASNKDALILALDKMRNTKISIAQFLALYKNAPKVKKEPEEKEEPKLPPETEKPSQPEEQLPPQNQPSPKQAGKSGGGGLPGIG